MTAPASTTLRPGDELLGKYRVERIIGRGGMGMVVAARHLTLGELFAIKVMLPEMLDNPEAVGRFLREARASSRLRGEHVARVHDVGTLENGVPYMVLEYLEGNDLDRELVTRKAFSVGEAAAFVTQVGEALLEAHQQGIIHRDLKPANLFLTRRPNGSICIKVLDFGISKDINAGDATAQKLTQTGSIMGSPHYMSPEQLVDSKNVDVRSDIWALGIILYELVTGTMPFHADTMPQIVAKVLSTRPPPPSQVRPGIPPAFDALVERCMVKEREGRVQSVQELLAALQPFVDEREPRTSAPVQIVPPSNPSAALSAQSAIGWEQPTLISLPPETAKSAPGSSKRTNWPFIVAGAVGLSLGLGLVGFMATRSKHHDPKEREESTANSANVTQSPGSRVPEGPATSEKTSAAPSATATGKNGTPNSGRTTIPVTVPISTTKIKNKVKGFDE